MPPIDINSKFGSKFIHFYYSYPQCGMTLIGNFHDRFGDCETDSCSQIDKYQANVSD